MRQPRPGASLRLVVSSASNAWIFEKLWKLKSLQSLSIEAPFLKGVIKDSTLPANRFFPRLERLDVAAKEDQLPLLFQILRPKQLVTTTLKIIGQVQTLAVSLILSTCLLYNQQLQNLSVSFVDGPKAGPRVREDTLVDRLLRIEQADCLSSELGALQHLEFNNVPLLLADSLILTIKNSLDYGSWKKIVFQVDCSTKTNEQVAAISNLQVPGLSILEGLLRELGGWENHPSPLHPMEHFEFLLDARRIADEDLLGSEVFKRREGSPDAVTLRDRGQHLRVLKVQTLQRLQLTPERKMDIAMYLNMLFPQLEVVQGSTGDGGVWALGGDRDAD